MEILKFDSFLCLRTCKWKPWEILTNVKKRRNLNAASDVCLPVQWKETLTRSQGQRSKAGEEMPTLLIICTPATRFSRNLFDVHDCWAAKFDTIEAELQSVAGRYRGSLFSFLKQISNWEKWSISVPAELLHDGENLTSPLKVWMKYSSVASYLATQGLVFYLCKSLAGKNILWVHIGRKYVHT